MHTAVLNLEEQFNLPLTQELIDEHARLRATLTGTKLPDSQIEKLTVPHVFENKLLINEGVHNDVFYSKDAIMKAADSAEEVGIVFDHLDTTQNEGTSNWLGHVINPRWDDNGEKGAGLYGDLKIVDKACAQTLASGPKWGVSPAINYKKNEVGDKVIGTDLLWKSFSFVLSPAVRETMLNNLKKQKGDLNMEPDKNDLTLHPEFEKIKVEKKKKEEEELRKKLDEKTLEALKAKDAEIAELQKFKDDIEMAKKTEQVSNLVASEFLIGRLEADELNDREKALMEKSSEVLTELSEVIGEHAELASFIALKNQYLKEHKGASMMEVAAAFKKLPKDKSKLSGTPAADPKIPGDNTPVKPAPIEPGIAPAQPGDVPVETGDGATEEPVNDSEGVTDPANPAADPAADNLGADPNAAANTATLTGHNSPAAGRGLAELREKGLGVSNEDKAMHAFLIDNGGR